MSDQGSLSEEDSRYLQWRWRWRRRIGIAQGLYPPELLLRGGRVLNVFTGELIEADVAIDAGVIASVGQYSDGFTTIDVQGSVVAPSFIDPHLHLESTLLWPTEFARAVVPHGTGAVITDPHEIANVAGLPGVEAIRSAMIGLPLDIRFTAPSCVPASAHESPGATFGIDAIKEMMGWPETVALGEVMNFPGVLAADPDIGARLWAARERPVDGHAPGLSGRALDAYASAGMSSDHESTSRDEAVVKLRAGLMVMMRQGSSEKNLLDILPLVNDENWHRFTFASDDRDCHDLQTHGHVDDILRTAIQAGLDPVRGIRMATWNPARHWRLHGLGAVAPGYRANLVILSDLESIEVSHTIYNGRVVAEGGQLVVDLPPATVPEFLRSSVNVAPVRTSRLQLPSTERSRAVEVIPGQIVTRYANLDVGTGDVSIERDLLKLVSVERHHATGRTGVGLVHGFGLQRGAIASSIAHDAHNIVAVGASDRDILAAIATVADSQGGLAVVSDLQVLAHLQLPIGGLVSDAPLEDVAQGYAEVEAAAKDLGCPLESPFGQLAFMSLSVIPEARVTDHGFIDVRLPIPLE